jgi:hypothetical protein
VEFFQQAGCSLVISPMPTEDFGINSSPLATLPAWVAPQADATSTYVNPSYGQQTTLDQFGPLGLTENGYAVPRNWGRVQVNALKDGLLDAMGFLNQQLKTSPGSSTNFWKYVNADVGTYPNTQNGYETRGLIVLAGGSANLAEDAVYAQANEDTSTSTDQQLSGDKTYTVRFAAPSNTIPANGTIPPLTLDVDGNPVGFWSMHVYQPDTTESSAPFLMQTASLNTAYSNANLDVISVDPTANTITAVDTDWALMKASSPVFFSGSAAASYGLIPGKPYYIFTDPTRGTSGTTDTITFQVSAVWKQELSGATPPVPIQNSVDPAGPGPVVDLIAVSGPFQPFQWGPIQSVSQLGSQQITSGLLKADSDGSYTIWAAPPTVPYGADPKTWIPTPPPGVDPHNWIPTPSSDYYNLIYGANSNVSTDIRLMIRMYDPAPGCPPPSILPPIDENGVICFTLPSGVDATYVFPAVNAQ